MPADIQMQLKRLGIHYERLAPPIETTEIAARRQATADRCPLVDAGTIPQSADGVMPHRARRLITLSTAATIAAGVAGFAWITERHQPPTTDVVPDQEAISVRLWNIGDLNGERPRAGFAESLIGDGQSDVQIGWTPLASMVADSGG